MLVTHNVSIAGLPDSMDGFKLVQLSDVHRRRIVPDVVVRRAVDLANSTNPDAIALTGDYEGRLKTDVEPCWRMLGKLRARRGVFAVLGNHDHWTGADVVSSAIQRRGIVLLNNSNAKLGAGLYICGIDDRWHGSPDARAALKNVPDDAALVMLSHDPEGVDLLRSRAGLMLSGHTHAGQIQLPLPGKWRYPGIRNWRFHEGWYRVGKIRVYVNRGIGMINPGVRFRCRPEVTLFVLHPK